MSSVISDLAAAAKATVLTVADPGVVWDYQPMPANDWATFLASFTADVAGAPMVRAVTIQYVGEGRTAKTLAVGSTKQRRDVKLVIRLHMSWFDTGASATTSESLFRDWVEAVADVLDANRSIGPAYDHDPVDVGIPNNGAGLMFGDVLCHYAELTLTAQVEQTLGTY